METEVLGNIPRLYTALADWLACLLYLFFLPKRTVGWRRYTIHAGFLLLLGVFMQATGQVPQFWFLPCIAVSILIMYLYIRMQADVPARSAGYYCVRAFIWGELAASLEWQLYYYMAGRQGTPGVGVRVGILAVVYAAVYGVVFALERNYNDIASPLHVHKKEFLSTLFIGVAVYAASNLSYVSPDTPFSGKMTAEIYNIRTLVDLGGMAILFAHHMQLVEYRRKKERDALQNVLQAQYAQYRSAQDSIDLINKKYHDLKHQIAVLRSETSEEKAHYLDAMEQEIRSYEAQNKTGNEVLDTILTSKSLYCQQHGITLTCVAD
uniref:ATP-binding protein n=1 Tax=Gemmiger sp. TaxID=2049027 RepID=UPI00307B0040